MHETPNVSGYGPHHTSAFAPPCAKACGTPRPGRLAGAGWAWRYDELIW